MKRVIVIGGGAGGILASIKLKEELKDSIEVIILEKEDRIGKKILKTGNGKCNITNLNASPSFYNDADFVSSSFSKYGYKEIRKYLESLGLLMKNDAEGRVYPLSESAASVLDLLKNKLEENKVIVKVNEEVIDIKKEKNKYIVSSINDKYECDYVIIASGSRAQIKNYNDNFIKSLKLKVKENRPGLVSIKVREKIVSLSGLRAKCDVKLYDDKKCVFNSFGEVLFKDDYLSGIVIMSCSRYIKNGIYDISLDLMKEYDEKYLMNYFNSLNGELKGEYILIGILPKMLSLYVLKNANISLNKCIKDFSVEEKKSIIKKLKKLEFRVTGVNDYSMAQIVMGGISLEEINKKSLELNKYSNIFVIGEVMDIDGECGGFNLSWAFSSAMNVCEEIKNRG